MMRVIGVDPDSEGHGVAIWEGGRLLELRLMTTVEIVDAMRDGDFCGATVYIEDNASKNFIYARNQRGNARVTQRVALSVGRVQQAQVELERFFWRYAIDFVRLPAQRGNWANSRKAFEAVTGWTESSNADTRSAAFYGWLGCRMEEKRS